MESLSLSAADFARVHGLSKNHNPTTTDGEPSPSPVLLCMDIEAWEHDHGKITEIGLASLEMVSPSSDRDSKLIMADWYGKMQHLHLRISENRRFVNRSFVKGHPDKFQFGTTIFVPQANVAAILERAFTAPSKLYDAVQLDVPLTPSTDELILIGHALGSDVAYAQSLQFEIPKHIRKIDTQSIPGLTKNNRPSLAHLLAALEIKYSYLHNAGNDAAYTLRALLASTAREVEAPGALGRRLTTAAQERLTARRRLRAERMASRQNSAAASRQVDTLNISTIERPRLQDSSTSQQ